MYVCYHYVSDASLVPMGSDREEGEDEAEVVKEGDRAKKQAEEAYASKRCTPIPLSHNYPHTPSPSHSYPQPHSDIHSDTPSLMALIHSLKLSPYHPSSSRWSGWWSEEKN